ILFGFREPDGSILCTDIGGQEKPGFNPEKGHGSVFRLKPDDSIEYIVPPKNIGPYPPFNPFLAPPAFGDWGGQLFMAAQSFPGLPGANRPHCVVRVVQGESKPTFVTLFPNAGNMGDGIAGAGVSAGFPVKGSGYAPGFYAFTMKNCTL